MDEALEAQTGEVLKTEPRDVYIYEKDTRGVTKVHHAIGISPKKEAQLEPLKIPEIDPRTLLEVEQPQGPTYYKPLEGDINKNIAQKSLERSLGRSTKPVFFVEHVPPQEKDKLLQQGYKLKKASELTKNQDQNTLKVPDSKAA